MQGSGDETNSLIFSETIYQIAPKINLSLLNALTLLKHPSASEKTPKIVEYHTPAKLSFLDL